ncbi:hypothetical protein QWZ10_12595 [Paracoccus cavernae]|uniref:Helicase ATP-binding domain-containing protein n=1 Tax=Paracoccus cavernae TaxID=1571207 RepID=A0ABT8D6L3_9RHOB|nr:hypothetical protein [Paracoccus cavernae]
MSRLRGRARPRVPLALMGQVAGRILMLEPRRLAARAAAERLAEQLGEALGESVGYRIRGESLRGARIEVVTEGILTRMLQSDPSLDGIGCVIFDEFHERSLNADLGLALVWEARAALRPDLAVLVMSATLDAEPVAAMLDDAPVIRSEGRAFPVETRWLDRPLPAAARLVPEAARLITEAEAATREGIGGTILAFLPGEERSTASPHCSAIFLPRSSRFTVRWTSRRSVRLWLRRRASGASCSRLRSRKPR